MKVMIEGSGRHVHITQEHLEALFGAGYKLESKKELSQPGQFASTARIDIEGPKGTIKNISILGPCRAFTQVELSFTDARSIGVSAPIRESGSIEGSAGATLHGPAGSVTINEGVIVAKRHVHFSPEDAAACGVADKQIIKVRTTGERSLIFDEVVARISPDFATSMHIDYDEVNAAACFGNAEGEIIVD